MIPGDVVDDLRQAADRGARLVRQLLTFSRRQPTRPEVVDLGEVVDGLAGMLRRLLGEKVSVQIRRADGPARVVADRGHLEQVLVNLAVNARDAMPAGGVLTIETAAGERATSDPGDDPVRTARLVVSDTGFGMTDEVKARIFEPFFSTKGPDKGTGLGLATVFGIVQQAGGTIEVESAPGAGTAFRLEFPRTDAPTAQSASVTFQSVMTRAGAGRGKAVLLVEDEEGVRRLARHTLESQGYAVTEAEDGETALTLLCPDAPPDLLVTDLTMPGMDGRELAERVRRTHPRVGVVFTSGYLPELEWVDELPAAVFVPKPFAPGDLLRAAGKAIRRAEAREAETPFPAVTAVIPREAARSVG